MTCLVIAVTCTTAGDALCQVAGPDFNGDGYAELIVGVQFEDVDSVVDAGAIHVIYGSGAGLNSTGDQFWHQNKGGVRDASEAGDEFGAALSWGDYDGDGFTDLAVGVPGEDLGTLTNAGAVQVFYGSAAGLTATDDQIWHQNSRSVLDKAEIGDDFGESLASGDFDGDGFTDLAVGSRGEDIGLKENAGGVNVLYGSALGLTGTDDQFWSQNSLGILDASEPGDNFGFALASGNFDGDGRDDLAIGVQDEDVGGVTGAGAVNVLYGSGSGLTEVGDQFWSQDSADILDAPENGDNFGFALVTGDFDGDGRSDLAVGVPDETVTGITAAGAVNVFYGSNGGLGAAGNQFWTQDSAGILDDSEDRDKFGHALGAGDFDGDGQDDLAVGVRDEDIGAISNAGAVNLIYGASGGLSQADNQFWSQGSGGLPGTAEASENFGDGLAAGDYDNDGSADLAIAIHDDDVGGVVDAGAVQAIYGSGTGLDAAGNQLWSQDSAGIVDSCETTDQFGAEVH